MKYAVEFEPVHRKIVSFRSSDVDPKVDEYVVEIEKSDLHSDGKEFFFIGGKVVIKDYDPDLLYNRIRKFEEERSSKKAKAVYGKIATEFARSGDDFSNDDVLAELKKRVAEEVQVEAKLSVANAEYEAAKETALVEINRTRGESITPQIYSAVCLLIRDENEYLEEWLVHHFNTGFEHFYIYDNGSAVPVTQAIASFNNIDKSKITVIDFPDPHENTQIDCYKHCLQTYGKICRWIAYIDTDEHITIRNGKSINEFLRDYELSGALYVPYEIYGADGQERKTEGLLRDRFKEVKLFYPQWGKSIVHSPHARQVMIHYPILHKGSEIVNEFRQNFENPADWEYKNEDCSIVVKHYYTKSYQEWFEKLSRGTADPWYSRKYKEFFKVNKDMLYLYDANITTKQKYYK